MKTLKILRLFAQGRNVVCMVLLFCTAIFAEPGYLDFDNLPETNFTCAGKVIGGYYADLETSCQMFHVCTIGQLDEPMDIKFLCLNGTVFDQETRVCERVDEVDCTRSERFYYLNLELYGNTMVPIPEDNDDDDDEDAQSESSSTTTIPSTTTSTTTTTTTTTRRPPPSSTPSTTRHTTTYRTVTKTSPPKKQPYVVSSTSKPKVTHFVTTSKSYEDDDEHKILHPSAGDEDEYAYDETDYPPVTDSKDLGNYQDSPGNHGGLAEQIFSPQQFIFNQNSNNNKGSLGTSHNKPAISFQQQQFQNGGSLTVTNSHVTVTTHTASDGKAQDGHIAVNKQFSSRPKETSTLVTAGPSTAEEDEQNLSGLYSGSTTRKPQYSYGAPPPTQNRTPLVPSSAGQQNEPTGHPGLPKAPSFQVAAHGFRLPTSELIQAAQEKHAKELEAHQQQIRDQLKQQQDLSPQEKYLRDLEKHQRRLEQLQQEEISKQQREQEQTRLQQEEHRQAQERQNQHHELIQQQNQEHQLQLQHQLQTQASITAFEGYRRHTPQVSLRLPIEHNPNQPQFLALANADSDFPQLEHKDTKRSDPHAPSSSNTPTKKSNHNHSPYPPNEYRETISSSSSRKSHQHAIPDGDSAKSATSNHKTIVTVTSQPRVTTTTSTSSSRAQPSHKPRHNYDRVLLTPQDQYLSTLPKVIITASASVSDASGKKLNYSVGNVIGPNIKIPPPSYDEYKEDDVVLDPFFLDVPKIKTRRIVRRSTATTPRTTTATTNSVRKKRKK